MLDDRVSLNVEEVDVAVVGAGMAGGERAVFGPRHTSEFEELGGSAYFEDVHKLVTKLAAGYNMPSKAIDVDDGYFASEDECVPLQGDTRADSILTDAITRFWERNSHLKYAREPAKEKELQMSFAQFCNEFGISPKDERFWISHSGDDVFPTNYSAAPLIAHP